MSARARVCHVVHESHGLLLPHSSLGPRGSSFAPAPRRTNCLFSRDTRGYIRYKVRIQRLPFPVKSDRLTAWVRQARTRSRLTTHNYSPCSSLGAYMRLQVAKFLFCTRRPLLFEVQTLKVSCKTASCGHHQSAPCSSAPANPGVGNGISPFKVS